MRILDSRFFPAQVVGAAFAVAVACGAGVAGAELPNVVLISIDTLRADHLSAYGYERPTSPSLDRLAAGGTVFTDVSAPSPWTRASHASLLTGLYPSRHGVTEKAHRLDESVPTLATRLAERGYATAAIVNSEQLDERFGFRQGFAEFDYVSEWSRWPPWRRRITDAAAAVTERALRRLAAFEGRPQFLFVHYYDVHSDYDPGPEARRLFVGPYTGPLDGGTQQLLEIQKSGRQLASADRDHLIDLYDAEIRQLDAQLGRLFDFLRGRGLLRNTVVAVTADHGEELAEHGSVLHGRTLYQEIVGVPLILRGAGVPPARRFARVAILVDVVPTLLSLTDAAMPVGLDGIDLSREWDAGEIEPGRRSVFAEADNANTVPDVKRMVRRGRWKLHYDRREKTIELYDLAADRAERVDRSKAEPVVVAELRGELQRFMRTGGAPSQPAEIPPAVRERLRDLGYGD